MANCSTSGQHFWPYASTLLQHCLRCDMSKRNEDWVLMMDVMDDGIR